MTVFVWYFILYLLVLYHILFSNLVAFTYLMCVNYLEIIYHFLMSYDIYTFYVFYID